MLEEKLELQVMHQTEIVNERKITADNLKRHFDEVNKEHIALQKTIQFKKEQLSQLMRLQKVNKIRLREYQGQPLQQQMIETELLFAMAAYEEMEKEIRDLEEKVEPLGTKLIDAKKKYQEASQGLQREETVLNQKTQLFFPENNKITRVNGTPQEVDEIPEDEPSIHIIK
jgi:archaellum component FlaC